MRNLVHAELLKLRTTRMFYGNALLALVGVPLAVALAIQTAGHLGSTAPLHTPEGVRNVLSSASSGTLLLLVIGILLMTNEARHNTATATFLIAPDRTKVVGAKLAAANTLYAIIGVGLGCLVRNQTAAIAATFVWMMVVEGIVTGFLPDVGRWLPGGAAAALTSSPTAHGEMLPMWAGASCSPPTDSSSPPPEPGSPSTKTSRDHPAASRTADRTPPDENGPAMRPPSVGRGTVICRHATDPAPRRSPTKGIRHVRVQGPHSRRQDVLRPVSTRTTWKTS